MIREFVLRFEKTLRLQYRYVNAINNPDSEWSDLCYKSLVLSLLKLLASDDTPIVNWDILDQGVNFIEKHSAEDPKLWEALEVVLESVIPIPHVQDFKTDKARLGLLTRMFPLVMGTHTIRKQLEADAHKAKDAEKALNEKLKMLKAGEFHYFNSSPFFVLIVLIAHF